MNGCPFHAHRRQDLPEPMPARIQKLPVDERGYPIPFFVDYVDGKPEFRAMDGRKFDRCLNEKLCWVCGERLKRHVAFVLGPMCTITRTSAEPPSHLECAEWSVQACPFLSKPQMKRREDELINNEMTEGRGAGVAILRNPGVSAVWVTTRYTIFPDDNGPPLIEVGDPVSVSWWREGRDALREEVLASIESGLPHLYNADPTDLTARAEIDRRYDGMKCLLPKTEVPT